MQRTCSAHGAPYELVDVDSDEALNTEYSDHVPVLIIDDVVRSYWFVDEAALSNWLRGEGSE